jgi:SecD/SecF fusion protein
LFIISYKILSLQLFSKIKVNMQGKGLLKAFLVLMAIICFIQLFYFIPTGRVERDAEDFANSISAGKTGVEKELAYRAARSRFLDSMSSEKIFGIPGLTSYTYSDLKRRQLNLGLDLKGGMSILLEVDLSEFISILAGRNAKDPSFIKAIENAKAAQKSTGADFITLFVQEFQKLNTGRSLASLFVQSAGFNGVDESTSDAVVIRELREKANQTVDLTYKMLKERIDRLGVVAPNISLDKARDMIMVELPGIDNPQRAREFVQKSAQLEFWETYRVTDAGIANAMVEADKRLAGQDTTSAKKDSTNTGGPLLSILSLNNPNNTGLQTVIGLAERNKKEVITGYLNRPEIRGLFPQNLKFMWSYKPQENTTNPNANLYELYAIKTIPNNDFPPLDGAVVTDASATQDQYSGKPQVSLSMNADGAKRWYDLTKKVYEGDPQGNKREIAIALDNEVVTAPSVNNGAIAGGVSSISGNFTTEEAVDLSNILEVGKLPAKVKIVQESNVGPSLGKENINKSLSALVIGFLLVLAFMVAYYSMGGIISIIALLLNVIFIFGTLSSLGTVLTLPGIAGIVLTIGMAVDANVIIYERIKEEIRSGKAKWDAIQSGFKASLSPIIDGNLTTIIVGFVLIWFGLGPIKGFGVVLVTGIITTLITAVLVSSLLIGYFTKDGQKDISFFSNWSKDALSKVNVDWMGKRKIAYIISGFLVLAGLISIFTRGFDLGVDFTGGHSYNIQVPASANITTDNLGAALNKAFGASTVVKKIDAENTYNVVTSYKIDETGESVYKDVSAKLFEGLKGLTNSNLTIDQFMSENNNAELKINSYNKVGPTVADDIKNSSWKAAIVSLILIFLYILFRFSRWQYSAGAVLATAHDALVTIGVFSLIKGLVPFSVEVDGAFVAAILTLIGYSINDTVIVFDRIREYVANNPGKTQDEVYNAAINSTFSRTIFTSLTVLLVVLALFFFGGSSIKNFSFALLIGIVFGTYSSIYIATAIMRDLTAKYATK